MTWKSLVQVMITVINGESFFSRQVESHVKDALSKGAKCLQGGQRHELGGNFFQPTILTEVTRDMIICKQETFGPVAPLIRCVTHHNSCPRKLCPPFENSAVWGLMVFDYIQNFRVLLADVAFFSYSYFWFVIFLGSKLKRKLWRLPMIPLLGWQVNVWSHTPKFRLLWISLKASFDN